MNSPRACLRWAGRGGGGLEGGDGREGLHAGADCLKADLSVRGWREAILQWCRSSAVY